MKMYRPCPCYAHTGSHGRNNQPFTLAMTLMAVLRVELQDGVVEVSLSLKKRKSTGNQYLSLIFMDKLFAIYRFTCSFGAINNYLS